MPKQKGSSCVKSKESRYWLLVDERKPVFGFDFWTYFNRRNVCFISIFSMNKTLFFHHDQIQFSFSTFIDVTIISADDP